MTDIVANSIAFQTGHTAEFYLKHEESFSILSHAELLKGFGANENLADEMLNDQGHYSNSNQLTDANKSSFPFILFIYFFHFVD